jgi:hypothetical protein
MEFTEQIADFLAEHRTTVDNIAASLPHVFEAVCYMLFVRHYEGIGFAVHPRNLLADGRFRFRYSTNGLPWRYSYFEVCERSDDTLGPVIAEIWHNQKVQGAWCVQCDAGVFAVDIAVIRPNVLPKLPFRTPAGGHRTFAPNADVLTFGESKLLIPYPMLLAQFLGIIHEILPGNVGFSDLGSAVSAIPVQPPHPPPTLFTTGHMSQGTKSILESMLDRRYKLFVLVGIETSNDADLMARLRCAATQADHPLEI